MPIGPTDGPVFSPMPSFTYTARTVEGKTVTGIVTADNQQHVLRTLDEQALFPVEVREGGKATTAGGGKKKVSPSKTAVVYSQFADLLRAGVPALRSLDVLYRLQSNPVLKEVLKEVREDLSSGQTLADAMEKHPNAFNPLHVSMIRAGEKGGFLEEVLGRIAIFVERQNELRNKVIGSMAYPVILMTVGTGVVVFLLLVVVPKIRSFLRGDLPLLTQIVFEMCDVLRDYGLWIGIGGAGLLVGLVGLFRSEAGRQFLDRAQLKVPKLGKLLVLVAVCRFCRILGTLLTNGVPILQSLKIARDSAGNTLLMATIDDAIEAVRKGASLAAPLGRSGFFPLDIVDIIAVGEESNNLDNVLITVADSYEARTGREIDLAVRLLEPVMLIIMAVVVGLIAAALLLPILNMSSAAG